MNVYLNGTDPSHPSDVGSSQRADTAATSAAHVESDQHLAEDTTRLSTDSAAVKSLTAKALTAPDVRQDKVEALRQAIQNGDYTIDPAMVAQALIRESE